MTKFEKDLEAGTRGRVDVQVFCAAQLFRPNQHHAAVDSGRIKAADILILHWGGTVPELAFT